MLFHHQRSEKKEKEKHRNGWDYEMGGGFEIDLKWLKDREESVGLILAANIDLFSKGDCPLTAVDQQRMAKQIRPKSTHCIRQKDHR